ncbi:MAG TPA: L-rhamnose mutarotase [Steroidobacter sp.]|uniref:L-rhamnose mutarotase n=1 Tax=Steroidobacter sp. TaxID=1978227 RepID=UPI002EDA7649
MQRLCFALDLKEDPQLIDQYRKWHEPGGPPPAVTRSLREAGIESLEIYLCGNRLFMLIEADATFSVENKARADAANEAVRAWEQLMWNFQQRLPWAREGEKWLPAQRIYDLNSQP